MSRRLRVILNPRSGRRLRRQELLHALVWLEERGWTVERYATRSPRHAEQLAADAAAGGCEAVLACGGDGTINEVVNGLAGSETALAVLPAGTVNIWACEAGISRRPSDAVRLLEAGARARLDLGRIVGSAGSAGSAGNEESEGVSGRGAGQSGGDPGRYFLLLVSVGSDSVAIRVVSSEAKRRWGRSALILAGARDLIRRGGVELSVESDERTVSGRFVAMVVGNTRLYGGLLLATGRARADDGLLDLCAYRGRTWRDLVPHVARTLLQRHAEHAGVEYLQARRFELTSTEPLPVQADGEDVGQTPVRIEVVPRALTVVVPAGPRSSLFGLSGAS